MRHMCILESTAHLSFHAHSIHTPMTGIPELSPPQKRIQSLNLCIFYMHNHIKCCQIHFSHIHGRMLSVADDEPRKKVDAHQEKHRTLRGSLQNDGVSP